MVYPNVYLVLGLVCSEPQVRGESHISQRLSGKLTAIRTINMVHVDCDCLWIKCVWNIHACTSHHEVEPQLEMFFNQINNGVAGIWGREIFEYRWISRVPCPAQPAAEHSKMKLCSSVTTSTRDGKSPQWFLSEEMLGRQPLRNG